MKKMHLGVIVAALFSSHLGVGAELIVPSVDYPTIQSAIDSAVDGDDVVVAPGAYVEAIQFTGLAITVRSLEGPEVTKIKPPGSSGVVRFFLGEDRDTILSGFTLTGGSGYAISDPVFGNVPGGGGVLCDESSPTIHDCILEGNTGWGAGLCIYAGSPLIDQCILRDNASEGHGGGVYVLRDAAPEILNSLFERNGAAWGGGMTVTTGSNPVIRNCTFVGNTVINVGCGIFIRSSSHPIIEDCNFIENIQSGNPTGVGGGICMYGVGNGGGPIHAQIRRCLFQGNQVTGDGGGIGYSYDCHGVLEDCTFIDNVAGRNGGGIAVKGAHDPSAESTPTISDCLVNDNTAGESGGGISVTESEPTISSCRVGANVALDDGGGIWLRDSSPTEISDTFVCGNLPDQIFGDYVDEGGNVETDSCDCLGDISGDDQVGVTDLLAVIDQWGACGGCSGDLNDDGHVGVSDLLIILDEWGPCP